MKYGRFLLVLVLPLMASCAFFKDYSKDNHWSYFEEWDNNVDSKIDKTEFAQGCVKDKFVGKKDNQAAIDSMFVKADENKDGLISGLEFYRWKIHVEEPDLAQR